MIHILTGPDDFSIAEALAEIKKGLGDQSLLAVNTAMLDGRQVTPGELRAVCGALPFLAEWRLVVVSGLLGRFEPRAKKGRQSRSTGKKKQSGYKLFSALADELPDSTVLVLIDEEIKKANPLLRELQPRARVRLFPRLRNRALVQWLQRRVKQEGGSITPRASEALARMVGGNLWIMAAEISKLVLFSSGGSIDEDDIAAVVGYAQQASVFKMVDAILESKARLAQPALQQLLQAGLTPTYLLFMLARQARMLIRAKEMIRQGKPALEIQNRLGISADFIWQKVSEQASGYSLVRLGELYHQLLDTDIAIKTGKYQPELALSILVAELCQKRGR